MSMKKTYAVTSDSNVLILDEEGFPVDPNEETPEERAEAKEAEAAPRRKTPTPKRKGD